MSEMRKDIAKLIGIDLSKMTQARNTSVEYTVLSSTKEDGYTRLYINYVSGSETVPVYLLIPDKQGNNPAVLINHQHNREHHLGKSEVCGLAGNPLQAFGPALAKKGFVVLAPDALCFEERREDPTVEGFDFWQHFHEASYRIVKGDYLMKQVLMDAINGISLLAGLPYVDKRHIGTLGHSMGGNTVLFLAALDERVSFACASGSACTYEHRMANGVGIEMASVIPGFHGPYDIDDLVSLAAPRKLLLVSAEEDKYSMDAPAIVEKAGKAYAEQDATQNLHHKRYPGGHALTQERFEFIIEWLEKNA
ncbi:MAG: dienelactone hydrolase family protein [Lachnospiraceae bacterium]|nr:dienelactone hydrolase family protein [Lachnospiraceae bacterium]MBQ8632743.1 dienelactone hydrolase family protein [Lachnospiraceae bacterium]